MRGVAEAAVAAGHLEEIDITPSSRNGILGTWYYTTGHTGGGAQAGVHLTPEEVAERMNRRYGPGEVIDDGVKIVYRRFGVAPKHLGEGI